MRGRVRWTEDDVYQATLAAAGKVIRLLKRVPVLVFVNNHFAGHAPTTIRQLHVSLGQEPPRSLFD